MTDIARTNRYLELDALRGFAVMGILAMNIVAFAMPFAAYTNPVVLGANSLIDFVAWAFNFVFIDSKMRGLFSVLFGASTLLVIQRAEASGGGAAKSHYARMFWLLIFGLAHFYLIWFGDILVMYALCGCILYLLRNASVKALWGWAIGFFLAQMLYIVPFSLALLAMVSGSMPAQPEMADAIAAIARLTGPDTATTAKELALYRGSYGEIVGYRFGERFWDPFIFAMQTGLETLGLMAIGMALFKSGALTGGWETARYKRWAGICLAISLPALVAMAHITVMSGFEPIMVFATSFAFSIPFDVLLTIAYALLLVMLARRIRGSEFLTRVACAGRAAFTNYLGTSILMTTIFYGYGLGLFGTIDRAALYLFVVGAWGLMLLWSKPWLIRYHYGPLEWLWRSLARMQLQPMRIHAN